MPVQELKGKRFNTSDIQNYSKVIIKLQITKLLIISLQRTTWSCGKKWRVTNRNSWRSAKQSWDLKTECLFSSTIRYWISHCFYQINLCKFYKICNIFLYYGFTTGRQTRIHTDDTIGGGWRCRSVHLSARVNRTKGT